mmetsp:Transcript_10695/g.14806  ORF Transcript_10695/g.14806 Transcript_10695/m.14806 type:complete len:148 (+) Transcript_10695:566-1009(+)
MRGRRWNTSKTFAQAAQLGKGLITLLQMKKICTVFKEQSSSTYPARDQSRRSSMIPCRVHFHSVLSRLGRLIRESINEFEKKNANSSVKSTRYITLFLRIARINVPYLSLMLNPTILLGRRCAFVMFVRFCNDMFYLACQSMLLAKA